MEKFKCSTKSCADTIDKHKYQFLTSYSYSLVQSMANVLTQYESIIRAYLTIVYWYLQRNRVREP